MVRVEPDRPDAATDPGRGRRLALDVGKARIGIAVSDPDGMLATPVETVPASTRRKGPDGDDVDRILELVQEYMVCELIIGLPLNMDGSSGGSVAMAKDMGFRIKRRLSHPLPGDPQPGGVIPIRYVDERLTTVVAQRNLSQVGRTTRESRRYIDQAAAVEILQFWLDQRRQVLGT